MAEDLGNTLTERQTHVCAHKHTHTHTTGKHSTETQSKHKKRILTNQTIDQQIYFNNSWSMPCVLALMFPTLKIYFKDIQVLVQNDLKYKCKTFKYKGVYIFKY